jgi:hypothetical protein
VGPPIEEMRGAFTSAVTGKKSRNRRDHAMFIAHVESSMFGVGN